MDSMKKLAQLMRALAEKEETATSLSLSRFHSCSSALSSLLASDCCDEHDAEVLRLQMESEGAHYEGLIAACMERITSASRLPEPVRGIVVAMTDDVRAGYELYLDAYCTLYDALAAGDAALCERAGSLAREGEQRITSVQRAIESTREELPLVA